jgi:hypothetical protein
LVAVWVVLWSESIDPTATDILFCWMVHKVVLCEVNPPILPLFIQQLHVATGWHTVVVVVVVVVVASSSSSVHNGCTTTTPWFGETQIIWIHFPGF